MILLFVSLIIILSLFVDISRIISSLRFGRNVIDNEEPFFTVPVIVPENSLKLSLKILHLKF